MRRIMTDRGIERITMQEPKKASEELPTQSGQIEHRFRLRSDSKELPSSPEYVAMVDHLFTLRPKFRICIELPEDLSTQEAQRLSDFVKTLPCEPEPKGGEMVFRTNGPGDD